LLATVLLTETAHVIFLLVYYCKAIYSQVHSINNEENTQELQSFALSLIKYFSTYLTKKEEEGN
jgi:hypothetical protein